MKSFRILAKNFPVVTKHFRIVTKRFPVVMKSFRIATKRFHIVMKSFRIVTKSFRIAMKSFHIVKKSFRIVMKYFPVVMTQNAAHATPCSMASVVGFQFGNFRICQKSWTRTDALNGQVEGESNRFFYQ